MDASTMKEIDELEEKNRMEDIEEHLEEYYRSVNQSNSFTQNMTTTSSYPENPTFSSNQRNKNTFIGDHSSSIINVIGSATDKDSNLEGYISIWDYKDMPDISPRFVDPHDQKTPYSYVQEQESIALLRREDGEVIRKLMNQLHEKSAMLKSMELQLNHSQLQVQALLTREKHLKAEKEHFEYEVASRDQDIVLLEAKLREIAGFERLDGIHLEDLRGELLDIANTRLEELSQIAIASEQKAEKMQHDLDSSHQQHQHDVEALVAEMRELSDQLAQRTVLYSAQERRWRDSFRSHESLDSEQKRELLFLRGQLQQLREQLSKSESERLETLLINRQQQEQIKEMELKFQDQSDKLIQLDHELAEANSTNIMLQQTVDRLRGADLDELERELAMDVMKIRSESRLREEQLLQRLEDAQNRLEADNETKQKLSGEIIKLQRQVDQYKELLHKIQSNHMNDRVEVNEFSQISHTDDREPKSFVSGQSDITSSDFSGPRRIYREGPSGDLNISEYDMDNVSTDSLHEEEEMEPPLLTNLTNHPNSQQTRKHRYQYDDSDKADAVDPSRLSQSQLQVKSSLKLNRRQSEISNVMDIKSSYNNNRIVEQHESDIVLMSDNSFNLDHKLASIFDSIKDIIRNNRMQSISITNNSNHDDRNSKTGDNHNNHMSSSLLDTNHHHHHHRHHPLHHIINNSIPIVNQTLNHSRFIQDLDKLVGESTRNATIRMLQEMSALFLSTNPSSTSISATSVTVPLPLSEVRMMGNNDCSSNKDSKDKDIRSSLQSQNSESSLVYGLSTDFLVGNNGTEIPSSSSTKPISPDSKRGNSDISMALAHATAKTTEKIKNLELQVKLLQDQEMKLRGIISEQRQQMAEILRRAAELPIPFPPLSPTYNINPTNSSASMENNHMVPKEEYRLIQMKLQDTESQFVIASNKVVSLEEQLVIYREEISRFDEKMKSMQEMTRHEIAETYSKKIMDFEQQIHDLKQYYESQHHQSSNNSNNSNSNSTNNHISMESELSRLREELMLERTQSSSKIESFQQQIIRSEVSQLVMKKQLDESILKEQSSIAMLQDLETKLQSMNAEYSQLCQKYEDYSIEKTTMSQLIYDLTVQKERLENEAHSIQAKVFTISGLQEEVKRYKDIADSHQDSMQHIIDELKVQNRSNIDKLQLLEKECFTSNERGLELQKLLTRANDRIEEMTLKIEKFMELEEDLRFQLQAAILQKDQIKQKLSHAEDILSQYPLSINDKNTSKPIRNSSQLSSYDNNYDSMIMTDSDNHNPNTTNTNTANTTVASNSSMIESVTNLQTIQEQHREELEMHRKAFEILLEEQKKKLSQKYKNKLQHQIERFQEELKQMQVLVQAECQEAIQQYRDSLHHHSISNPIPLKMNDHDKTVLSKNSMEELIPPVKPSIEPMVPNTIDADNNTNTNTGHLEIHPEMLSPETTLLLMRRVVKRFTNMEDVKVLLQIASKGSDEFEEEFNQAKSRTDEDKAMPHSPDQFTTPRTSTENYSSLYVKRRNLSPRSPHINSSNIATAATGVTAVATAVATAVTEDNKPSNQSYRFLRQRK